MNFQQNWNLPVTTEPPDFYPETSPLNKRRMFSGQDMTWTAREQINLLKSAG